MTALLISAIANGPKPILPAPIFGALVLVVIVTLVVILRIRRRRHRRAMEMPAAKKEPWWDGPNAEELPPQFQRSPGPNA